MKCKCGRDIQLKGTGCACDELDQSAVDYLVTLPRRLTAENGAKAALMGEFRQAIPQSCEVCSNEVGPDPKCPVCHGHGEYTALVNISWTNIKAIYAAIVQHFEATPSVSGE